MTNILVVDDDPALLRMVSLLLRLEAFGVQVAHSGQEGLEVLDAEAPDLIVLDLSMPGMDGREFFRQARQNGYQGPVLICSAYGAGEAQRALGASGAISKPFEIPALVDEVKRLVGAVP